MRWLSKESLAEKKRQLSELQQNNSSEEDISDVVQLILQDVQQNGDPALMKYSESFDGIAQDAPFCVDQASIKEAWDNTNSEIKNALKLAKERITAFHELQQTNDIKIEEPEGGYTQLRYLPVNHAGLYIPGGKACYPSSVLMNVIPAQVAGVNKITLFSPPVAPGKVADIVMAVAYLCGVDRIVALGGAQAIAAMAYGTATIDKVDVIAGPGNAYVAEAKRQVQGLVGIDSIAGPTEVMVMAGKSANPTWIAADLLAQAEHDQEAMSILMSPDLALLKAVEFEVEMQLDTLPKKDIAQVSLWNKGVFIQLDSYEEGVELANSYGPGAYGSCG